MIARPDPFFPRKLTSRDVGHADLQFHHSPTYGGVFEIGGGSLTPHYPSRNERQGRSSDAVGGWRE